jgi:hypothetical protein
MKNHFLLGEVARILNRKPHHVVYPLVTGQIPEPETRIGGKRLFTVDDVERLGRHFGARPNWSVLEPVSVERPSNSVIHLKLRPPYEVCQINETGHEIRDGDGEVFAWSADRGRALVLAGLLETAARG